MVLGSHCDGGSSDVPEWDGVGHFDGDARGKSTNLFMYVHEKSVGFPPTHFLDGVGVNAIEVHGHGTASAEGVATDVAFGVAKVVEANLASRLFEGGVDVLGSYGAPGGEKGVFEAE